MKDVLEEVKERLSGGGYRLGEQEKQALVKILENAGSETTAILKWVFAEHKGYVDTRSWAGVQFLKSDMAEGWRILAVLVKSSDPDDRDTALLVLSESDSPQAHELARLLLVDPLARLQLDAADFLRDIYPQEVEAILSSLAHHQDKQIREEAQKRLRDMEQGR